MNGSIVQKKRTAAALLTVVLLVSGCAGGELSPELLPSVQTVAVPQKAVEATAGPVHVESEGEVPFYARFDEPVHDDDWAVIIFYRPPHCIPEDFNLLRSFHLPGENDPGAFACGPPTTSGIEIWEHGPQVDFAPLHSDLHGRGSVPVWFAAWPEVKEAMNDGFVTIGELEALPSRLPGTATTYSEFLRPSETNAEPMIAFTAEGVLDDGHAFEVDVHQELVDRENNHVWIEIAE